MVFDIVDTWSIIPKFGSEALKQQHLPPIVRGEIRWCQGYSEPNAGSDLAGLQSKGVDMGDHLLANGQKVWTSYGDKADWMFCLLRTDPDAKKQMGISLVLFDTRIFLMRTNVLSQLGPRRTTIELVINAFE